MILACDQYEETTRLAWGNTPEEVALEEYEGQTESVRRIQELGKNAERIVVPEGSPLVRAVAREGVMVSPVRRLEAAYWGLREQVNGADCLILSLGKKCCTGGVVKRGHFIGEFASSPGLGLRDLCEEWIEQVQTLRLGIESVFGEKSLSEAREEFFTELLRVLQGGKGHLSLLTSPLNLAQAAGPYLKIWKDQIRKFLIRLDPEGEIQTLACIDWAATGSLTDMFQGAYKIVRSPYIPLTEAVHGMLLFERRAAKSSPEQPIELWGKQEEQEAGVETPRQKIQKAEHLVRQLLTEGKHEEAIPHLDFLCRTEPENEDFRLWRLLSCRLQEMGERSSEEDRLPRQETTSAALAAELKDQEVKRAALEKQVRSRGRFIVLLSIGAVVGLLTWSTQMARRSAAITALQNELESRGQQIISLQDELDGKNRQIAAFTNKNTAIDSEIDKQIIALNKEVIEQKDGQIQSLEKKLQDALASNTDSGEQFPDGRVVALEQDVKGKEARIAILERDLSEKTQSVAILEQDREEKAKRIAALQQELKGGKSFPSPIGQYVTVRRVPLLRAPRENADIVAWLNRDQKVRVVRVEGTWLRVESSYSDKPPGYLRREDAEPVLGASPFSR